MRGGRRPACRCGHARDSHPSFVPDGDKPGYCASCECWQYRPERPWALALAFLRERPAPVTADVLRPRPVRLPVPDPVGYDDKTEFGLRVPLYVLRPRGDRSW